MKKYVAGFMFSKNGKQLSMVKKKNQNGKRVS